MNDLKNVLSFVDGLLTRIENIPSNEQVKNDYETFKSFVSQFPVWLDLGQKYKKNPGELLKLFASLGNEVLSRSNDKLIAELSDQFKKNISVSNFQLSDDAINSLDSLIKFLRIQNKGV